MDMTLYHADRAHGDEHDHGAIADVPHVRVVRRPADRPTAAPSGAGWYHDAAIESARQNAVEDRCNPYGARRG